MSLTKDNVAAYLPEMARQQPDAVAIYFPTSRTETVDGARRRRYDELTYRDLDRQSDEIAAGLLASGFAKGDRAALMVRPSPELFTLTFGLFKAGIVPVMIDPGLGRAGLKSCLERAAPSAFIGIPVAHAARKVLGWGRGSVTRLVTVGRRWFWGGLTLEAVQEAGARVLAQGPGLEVAGAEDVAAILFTSGSTGPPKGVVYSHRSFVAQVESIRELFGIEPGEVDLPTFPLFALFDPALGMTTVLPKMDASKPAAVDPDEVLGPIERFGVTTLFGSPALLRTVGVEGARRATALPGLRRVIAAGAPLPGETMQLWHGMLSEEAALLPSYGATECLPISCIDSHSILRETWPQTVDGYGVCVGSVVPTLRAEILALTDEPIASWSDDLRAEPGVVGEIAVRGPMVTEEYFADAGNTERAKIRSSDGIWHRMGDLGWRDEQGRLWFCGRKSQRVGAGQETLFTVACEKVFDAVEGVRRTAVVGPQRKGRVEPTLCVELENASRWGDVLPKLREIRDGGARGHARVDLIERFLQHSSFPVDVRHNAKLGREELTVWAERVGSSR
ncbi:MAG: fatty acid CoA ligase family protein [Acidobacteriota bacterium]